jgi:hypothetical protein
VEALSFTSTLSIGLSALFVTITFSLVLYRLGRGSIRGVEWVPLPETKPSNLLEMLPVLMILYVCHYNVHPIFAGMRRPTEKRMRRVVKTSLIFTTGGFYIDRYGVKTTQLNLTTGLNETVSGGTQLAKGFEFVTLDFEGKVFNEVPSAHGVSVAAVSGCAAWNFAL